VTSAAAGAKEVVTLLDLFARAAAETHASAQTVLSASTAVDSAATQLRAEVETFLHKVQPDGPRSSPQPPSVETHSGRQRPAGTLVGMR
jgi:hypothetical protein